MGNAKRSSFQSEKELADLKKQLLEECKRLIKENGKKRSIKR